MNSEINSFIEVYGQDMSKAEQDLLREMIDNFASDIKKQNKVLDLLHGLIGQAYDDGLRDAAEGGDIVDVILGDTF